MSSGSASEPFARYLFLRILSFYAFAFAGVEASTFSITFSGSATSATGSIGSSELVSGEEDDFFFAFFSRSRSKSNS
ncbi:hypothetical protein ACFX13_007148 [Malus domestica]